jgi:putative tricarboxylic transport membrane protein
MKRPYQITALILLLLSAVTAYQSLQFKYYTPLGPGPGFFPFWISIILVALSLIMLGQAVFKISEPLPSDFFDSRRGYLKALAICVSWLWVALFLKSLGYQLTMLVFFPFLLLTMGRVRWYTMLIITTLGSFGSYWCFSRLFRVSLPTGPFDELILGIGVFFKSLI